MRKQTKITAAQFDDHVAAADHVSKKDYRECRASGSVPLILFAHRDGRVTASGYFYESGWAEFVAFGDR